MMQLTVQINTEYVLQVSKTYVFSNPVNCKGQLKIAQYQ